MRSPTAHRLVALCGVGALMLVAACDPASDGDARDVARLEDAGASDRGAATTDAPLDPDEAVLAYTACMREHGVELDDPRRSADGNAVIVASPVGPAPGADGESGGGGMSGSVLEVDEDFAEAERTCSPILEDAFGAVELDPELVAEQREQMLDYAECMRDNGVDMPDPQFDEDGRVMIAVGDSGGPGSAEWRAADETCAGLLGAGPGIVVGGDAED